MADFIAIFARPIAGLLSLFYDITHSYAGAIILLTLAVMLVLLPLTLKGTRSMLAMQRLQPEMRKLQDLHKDDRIKLNMEMQALFRDNKINPMGGCFPLLAQLPVFLLLYDVIHGLTRTRNGTVSPKYLSTDSEMYRDLVSGGGEMVSFGVDLAKKATDVHASLGAAVPFYVLIVLMVAVQYWATHQALSRNSSNNQSPQAQQLIKIQKFLPLIFGIFAFGFVAGLVLYWLVSALFRVAQTAAIYKFDPQLKKTVASAKKEADEMIARDTGSARAQKSGPKRITTSTSKNKKKRKGR